MGCRMQLLHAQRCEIADILIFQKAVGDEKPSGPPVHNREVKGYEIGDKGFAGACRALEEDIFYPLVEPVQDEIDRLFLERPDAFGCMRKKVDPIAGLDSHKFC